MNATAELEHWSRRVDYLLEEATQLTLAGEPEYAAIFEKAIPSAIQQRERWRHVVLSGK